MGDKLPQPLFDNLAGKSINSKRGKALLISTIDDLGWPHLAMLSFWEVVARSLDTINVGLYSSGTSANNLRSRKNATLIVIDAGIVSYVKALAQESRKVLGSNAPFSIFHLTIRDVLEDSMEGVRILHGVEFEEVRTVEEHETVFRELLR